MQVQKDQKSGIGSCSSAADDLFMLGPTALRGVMKEKMKDGLAESLTLIFEAQESFQRWGKLQAEGHLNQQC